MAWRENRGVCRLGDPGWAALKRVFDVLASLVLLVVLSPLMLVLAIGVWLSGPGPVLFRQERVGCDGVPFTMLKFRSMRPSGEAETTTWTAAGDPRRTGFGIFMRRYSLDELPQLLNVLAGSMSLVGPRPEVPYFAGQFAEEIPGYELRCQVRPGITGWAQVNGLRGDTSIERRVEHDLWYIRNWSPVLDARIVLRTICGGMVNRESIHEAGDRP